MKGGRQHFSAQGAAPWRGGSGGGSTPGGHADPVAAFFREGMGDRQQNAANAHGSAWRGKPSSMESRRDHQPRPTSAHGSARSGKGFGVAAPWTNTGGATTEAYADFGGAHGRPGQAENPWAPGQAENPWAPEQAEIPTSMKNKGDHQQKPRGSAGRGHQQKASAGSRAAKAQPAWGPKSKPTPSPIQNVQNAKCPSPIQKENVKMRISRESESLMRAALEASSGVSEFTPSEKRQRENDEEELPSSKCPRRQHEATVPPWAPGSWKLQSTREALPTFEFRAEILDAIHKNQIVIVEGETGCGKTTQVGQFIIEEAAEKNTPCSVVCTQPRRISAIAVSERVADERGERIGDTIGYSVRQDAKAGRYTHLLFSQQAFS